MSLTKDDLQQIREVVREEIDTKVPEIVRKEIDNRIDAKVPEIVRKEIDGTRIREIVREEVDKRITEQDETLGKTFNHIQDQFDTINERFDSLENEIQALRVDLNLTKTVVAAKSGKKSNGKILAELAAMEMRINELRRIALA